MEQEYFKKGTLNFQQEKVKLAVNLNLVEQLILNTEHLTWNIEQGILTKEQGTYKIIQGTLLNIGQGKEYIS